ncbi:head-tail connector protein [Mycobacterium phage Phlei]|uniref:Head-to-tail connector protein n=1 Tax=Mycobacterium phage Phlei TaxID=1690684 RepID=A0A0N9BDQ1_9CAUD|nr:head-tail connector protein [Mycobacterium phage Phlei]ALA48127.1 hypothetical protein [Mycobacterium phage Phlei]
MIDPSAKQPKAPYPPGFIVAVKPEQVNPKGCKHEATPPVCNCAHDWRITWGNVERRDS